MMDYDRDGRGHDLRINTNTKTKRKSHSKSDYKSALVASHGNLNQNQRELLSDNQWQSGWQRREKEQSDSGSGINGWGESIENHRGRYAFGIKFLFEYILYVLRIVDAINDYYDVDISVHVTFAYDDSVIITHFFPRFDKLVYPGGCIYYQPTFDYYAALPITASDSDPNMVSRSLPAASLNGNNNAGYNGEDANSHQLKTEPVETDNGFFTKIWNSMPLLDWILVIGGVCLFIILCCCICAFICYRRKQNTHEKNSFVSLE